VTSWARIAGSAALLASNMPGYFLRVGAPEPGGEPTAPHSPRFAPAEESLFVGAAVLAECARVASDRSS